MVSCFALLFEMYIMLHSKMKMSMLILVRQKSVKCVHTRNMYATHTMNHKRTHTS